MELEIINKLFLELSQVSTAKTAKEIQLEKMLFDTNDVCRSLYQIVNREGANTNWTGIKVKLEKILEDHHDLMYGGKNGRV